MAIKGLNTKIDVDALTSIIVFANSYRDTVAEQANDIKTVCKQMADCEYLDGGDGTVIRETFASISVGCTNLEKSMDEISKVLNDKLEKAIKMRHGSTLGDSQDAAAKANRKVGVLNKE